MMRSIPRTYSKFFAWLPCIGLQLSSEWFCPYFVPSISWHFIFHCCTIQKLDFVMLFLSEYPQPTTAQSCRWIKQQLFAGDTLNFATTFQKHLVHFLFTQFGADSPRHGELSRIPAREQASTTRAPPPPTHTATSQFLAPLGRPTR